MANILPLDKALDALSVAAADYSKAIADARKSNHVMKIVAATAVTRAWTKLAAAQWEVETATSIERARQTGG